LKTRILTAVLAAAVLATAALWFYARRTLAPPPDTTTASDATPFRKRSSVTPRDTEHRQLALTEKFTQLAARDPRKAISQADAALTGDDLSIALADILGTWTASDPHAALDWLASNDRDDTSDLRAHVLFTWAETDPAATASWLEQNPDRQEPQNLLALLGPWMESDERAAAAWSTTRLDPIPRGAILADLLAGCQSIETATALIRDVDPVVADAALDAARITLADEQPELAEALSGLISNPPAEEPQDQTQPLRPEP
jgi:hypothetical protein